MIDKRCLKDIYLQIMTLERVLRSFLEEMARISADQISSKHKWVLGNVIPIIQKKKLSNWKVA